MAPVGTPLYVMWAALVMGGSILPDADMKRTVADELFGPFTRGIRWGTVTLIPGLWTLVRPFLGGHRGRTHRIEGVILFLAGLWLCTLWRIPSTIVVVLGAGLALRTAHLILEWLFGIRYRKRYWLPLFAVSLGVGWLFWTSGAPLPVQVPFALAFACLVHIGGDILTDAGVKVTFASEKKVKIPEPFAFKAGGWVENTIVVPPMLIAAVLVVCYQAGYDPVGSVLEAHEERVMSVENTVTHLYNADSRSGAGNCTCGMAERHRCHYHQFMPGRNRPDLCTCALPPEAACHWSHFVPPDHPAWRV